MSPNDGNAKPRKRSSAACDRCSRKKTKCDAARPICGTCAASNAECTYSRPSKRRGPPPGYFSSIMQRLKTLETRIADAEQAPVQTMQPFASAPQSDPSATAAFAAAVAAISNASFDPLAAMQADMLTNVAHMYQSPPESLLAAQPMTMQNASAIDQSPEMLLARLELQLAAHPAAAPSPALTPAAEGMPQSVSATIFNAASADALLNHPDTAQLISLPETPSSAVIVSLRNDNVPVVSTTMRSAPDVPMLVVFMNWFNPKLPIFDCNFVAREAENIPPALLGAMYALACTAPQPDGRSTYNAGDRHFTAAKIALEESIESPTAYVVAAAVLLAAYAAGSGRGTTSTVLIALALRLAQQLRLDREGDLFSKLNYHTHELEFRRRLWYALYETDFYSAFATNMSFLVAAGTPLRVQPPEANLTSDALGGCTAKNPLPSLTWLNQMATAVSNINGTNRNGSISGDSAGAGSNSISGDTALNSLSQSNGASALSDSMPSISTGETANVWTLTMKLQDLARRVIMFVRTSRENDEIDNSADAMIEFDEDMERTILDGSLESWFSELPPTMQVVYDSYSDDRQSVFPPPWRIAYLQCLYFFLHMTVHLNTIVRLAEEHQNSMPPASDPSVQKGFEMATRVTQILQSFAKHNASFHSVSPFIGRIIYHTGMTHVLAMRFEGANIANLNSFVDLHLQALQKISAYSLSAGHESRLLETFRVFPFRQVRTAECPKI